MPEIQRQAGGWNPPDEPLVEQPQYMRPGLDVLKLRAAIGEFSAGTPVIYLSQGGGYAVVGVPRDGKGILVFRVACHLVDEFDELVDQCNPDAVDFTLGYEQGRWELLAERPTVGRTAVRRAPTWFGRGLVAGYRDRDAGRLGEPRGEIRAFNKALREVAFRHPEELPYAMPWERRL